MESAQRRKPNSLLRGRAVQTPSFRNTNPKMVAISDANEQTAKGATWEHPLDQRPSAEDLGKPETKSTDHYALLVAEKSSTDNPAILEHVSIEEAYRHA